MLRLGLTVLLLFLLVACGGTGAEPEPPKPDPAGPSGVIMGTLRDSGGEVVAGAQVVLSGGTVGPAALTPVAVAAATTDELGRFAIDVNNEGTYTLTALLDTEGALERVTVTRDGDGELTAEPFEVETAPYGGVAGRVAGKGAGVWAFLLGTSFLASTDSDGEFLISRVPAGEYQLAAGVLGAVGAAVDVTVSAGEVTTVATALELGPVITGVEPEGLSIYDYYSPEQPSLPDLYTISGRGFGADRGASRVFYLGVDMTSEVIEWSDTEIILNRFFGTSTGPRSLGLDALRFEVATPAGSAFSAPVGAVNAILSASSCISGDWEAYLRSASIVAGLGPAAVDGLVVELDVANGSALTGPGGEVVDGGTVRDGCASVYLEPDGSGRPVIVGATVAATEYFDALELVPVAQFLPWVEATPLDLEPGENLITGYIRTWDSTEDDPRAPLDDGSFAVEVSGYGVGPFAERFPLSFGPDGYFEFIFVPPDEGCYWTSLYYGQKLMSREYSYYCFQ